MSGENVITISGINLSEANSDVVLAIERLLEQAKSGDIDGLTYAVSYTDGASSFQSAGVASHSLIGAIDRAKYRLLAGFEHD